MLNDRIGTGKVGRVCIRRAQLIGDEIAGNPVVKIAGLFHQAFGFLIPAFGVAIAGVSQFNETAAPGTHPCIAGFTIEDVSDFSDRPDAVAKCISIACGMAGRCIAHVAGDEVGVNRLHRGLPLFVSIGYERDEFGLQLLAEPLVILITQTQGALGFGLVSTADLLRGRFLANLLGMGNQRRAEHREHRCQPAGGLPSLKQHHQSPR